MSARAPLPAQIEPDATMALALREKKLAAQRRWREANREKARESSRRSEAKRRAEGRDHASKNPGAPAIHRAAKRAWRERNVERIWGRERPGTCEICGSANAGKKTVNDHDHTTGYPRLFLCDRCNLAEGYLAKEWWRVKQLIAYHYWVRGYRDTLTLTIPIKDAYPTCPTPSPEDIAWVRRYIGDERRRRHAT